MKRQAAGDDCQLLAFLKKELQMFIPPSGTSGGAAQTRRLMCWASLLFLASVIGFFSALPAAAAPYADWLQLAAVLSGVGAAALFIAAAVSYRRQRVESLFPADSLATRDPRVLWSEGDNARSK